MDHPKKLSDQWRAMEGKKNPLLNRSENYAMWTLPYICPPTDVKDTELQNTLDGVGARAVNHLSNKLIRSMYPDEGSFLRMDADDPDYEIARQEAKAGDADAIEFMNRMDEAFVKTEQSVLKILDKNRFRVEAITVCKGLIITGNSLQYFPENENEPVQTYPLRDFCVERDLSGRVIKIMTRDSKALNSFDQKIIDKIRAHPTMRLKKGTDSITLYTLIEYKEDKKYHLSQSAEDVDLESSGSWPEDKLPWITLTWNLIRGEDYGRGLVEDFAGTFHALYVLNQAFVNAVAVAADIKWLVNPSSVLDVKELNDSKSGSYHSGADGDVVALQLNKSQDLAVVLQAIERFERQIAQAFLLNSAITRNAERVTAEEIRDNIRELETAHGGIYTRLAHDWQTRVGILALNQVDVKVGEGLNIKIITGAESLSRAGDLDNVRGWLTDLSILNSVPEMFQGQINPGAFAEFLAIRRNLDPSKFLKSREQLYAEQQQAMEQQRAMMQSQSEMNVMEEAGKEMVRGE